MILLVILSLLNVNSNAASLGTAYLPPPNAKDAGGHEDDLELPLEPPYIDQYSDNRHLVPEDEVWRGFGYNAPTNRSTFEVKDPIWDFSDGLSNFRGRFLYGSYTYEGPDNVIVTVTYTGDGKKRKNRRKQGYGHNDWGSDNEDGGYFDSETIPTPPSLPWELQKAFFLHQRMFAKDNRNDNQRGKHLKNEGPTERPVIHQGYSLPKIVPINHTVYNLQQAATNQN